MENSKYYIPDISEFYIGFEYEFNCPTGRKGEKEWKKEIYNEQKWFHSSSLSYDWLIKEGDIRVKYLDKKDIEELGFKGQESNTVYFEREGYRLVHWFQDYIEEPNRELSIYKVYGKEDEQMIFRGKIKNVSELRKLLKQIGIENESIQEDNKR